MGKKIFLTSTILVWFFLPVYAQKSDYSDNIQKCLKEFHRWNAQCKEQYGWANPLRYGCLALGITGYTGCIKQEAGPMIRGGDRSSIKSFFDLKKMQDLENSSVIKSSLPSDLSLECTKKNINVNALVEAIKENKNRMDMYSGRISDDNARNWLAKNSDLLNKSDFKPVVKNDETLENLESRNSAIITKMDRSFITILAKAKKELSLNEFKALDYLLLQKKEKLLNSLAEEQYQACINSHVFMKKNSSELKDTNIREKAKDATDSKTQN